MDPTTITALLPEPKWPIQNDTIKKDTYKSGHYYAVFVDQGNHVTYRPIKKQVSVTIVNLTFNK